MTRTHAGYIYPLDGLRALAILMVLMFHIDESIYPGGFIGVDFFFVISGFIITRAINSSIIRNEFSLLDFYTRRVARLTPAVSATVVFTIILSYFIYDADRTSEISVAGFYSIISVSNIYFWMQSGYFDTVSQGNPFLHTWSLGVEEQFYIFWPLLLVFLKARLIVPLAAIIALGTGLSVFTSAYFPSAAFYLAPARIFQFAIGAGAWVVLDKRPNLFRWDRFGSLGIVGVLILIGLGLVINGHNTPYLLSAVVPALAASLALLGMRGGFANLLSWG